MTFSMASLLWTSAVLLFGTILVDAADFVTQEQLRALLAVKDGQIRELTERLDHQESLLTQCSESQARASRHAQTPLVAFSASLSNHLTSLGTGQNLLFDTVITNAGNGYSPIQGTFTAPVAGMYVFSTTLLSHANHNDHFQLVHNGNLVYRLYVGGGGSHNYDTTGSSVVIQLQEGDTVSVQNLDVNEAVWGDLYSMFTGYLLKASEGEETVIGK